MYGDRGLQTPETVEKRVKDKHITGKTTYHYFEGWRGGVKLKAGGKFNFLEEEKKIVG